MGDLALARVDDHMVRHADSVDVEDEVARLETASQVLSIEAETATEVNLLLGGSRELDVEKVPVHLAKVGRAIDPRSARPSPEVGRSQPTVGEASDRVLPRARGRRSQACQGDQKETRRTRDRDAPDPGPRLRSAVAMRFQRNYSNGYEEMRPLIRRRGPGNPVAEVAEEAALT